MLSKTPKRFLFHLKTQLFFSNITPSNKFDVKLDVFYSSELSKRFYLPFRSSLFSVENIIKDGDTSVKTVEFSIDESTPIDKSSQFLDIALKKNLKLMVNSQTHAYKIDEFGDLGFFTNSKYDDYYKEKEIPFPQASVFSSLFQAYDTRFSQENSNQIIKASQFQENLMTIMKGFAELNQIQEKQIEANLVNALNDFDKESKHLELIEVKLASEAKKTLKFWLALTTIQFVVLFYICYYAYGWDFTEPLGYLISLGIETAAIAYFLKFKRDLGQNVLFASKINKLRPKALAKKSTNPNATIKFLNEKVSILKRSHLFTRI